MELYFKGTLDNLDIEYTDKDIFKMIKDVLEDNPWENFIRTYDLRDKLTDKMVPVLDILPEDVDPEYMWIINGHTLVCIDDGKLIGACHDILY